MGSRMVANLLTNAGQEVVVCDDRAQALHEASALGAETVSTPAALASTPGMQFFAMCQLEQHVKRRMGRLWEEEGVEEEGVKDKSVCVGKLQLLSREDDAREHRIYLQASGPPAGL